MNGFVELHGFHLHFQTLFPWKCTLVKCAVDLTPRTVITKLFVIM